MTPDEIRDLIEYRMSYKPMYGLDLGCDPGPFGEPEGGRYYLQANFLRPDIITGHEEIGYGGKIYLSEHMTKAEVVRKAFQAFRDLEEHECREWFRVDLGKGPRRVFGPHISIEALYDAAPYVDVRSPTKEKV